MALTPSTILTARLINLMSGKETAFGTALVPATAKWMAVKPKPQFKPHVKTTVYDEERATLAPGYLGAILEKGGEFQIDRLVTYEDILFELAGCMGVPTPTGSYTWTFAAPTTTVPSPQSYTFEFAYDISTIQATGALIQKLTIKAESQKNWESSITGFYKSHLQCPSLNILASGSTSPIKITTSTAHNLVTGQNVGISGHLVNTTANGNWVITKVDGTSFTLNGSTATASGGATGIAYQIPSSGSVVDRTVEIALMPTTTLAIDTAGGTVGTTNIPSALLGFQLDYETGFTPVYTNNSYEMTGYTYNRVMPKLSLDLLYTTEVKNAINSILFGGTGALVDLKTISGSKQIELQFAGVMGDQPTLYTDKNIAEMVQLKLDGMQDTGAFANYFKAIVTNTIAAIP